MTEWEMIIKALECCAHIAHMCRDCPMTEYRRRYNAGEGCDCHSILADKALTLLKAQVPVEPKLESASDETHWYSCECGTAIDYKDAYCRGCGRPVKWE